MDAHAVISWDIHTGGALMVAVQQMLFHFLLKNVVFCLSDTTKHQGGNEADGGVKGPDFRDGGAGEEGGRVQPFPQDEEGGGDAEAAGSPGPTRGWSEGEQTAAERAGGQQGGAGGDVWSQVQTQQNLNSFKSGGSNLLQFIGRIKLN